MPCERVQRHIDRLLDDFDSAPSEGAWPAVAEKARAVHAVNATPAPTSRWRGRAWAARTACPPVPPVETAPGTMLGTGGYMPPEQALDGQMTPRSDVYALGAVLDELATGGPPFKGAHSPEAVSQHIHFAPAPLSARGSLIPRPLEELTPSLLARDAAQRPASAAEVRAVLQALNREDSPLPPEPSLSTPGVFAGCSRERAEPKRHHGEAASTSRIALLVGQLGIGKTRLAQELEGHARSRGARVLWARSSEAPGAPPYSLRCAVRERRCHRLVAHVLGCKGDDLAAVRHPDAATALVQRHGVRLYLDHALEQRALLKA